MKTCHHPILPRAVVLVASTLLCLASGPLSAEEPLSTTTQRFDETAGRQGDSSAAIGAKFTTFAGSEENATALVTGLRNGTAVSLTTTAEGQPPVVTEFQPATSKLGYGNAFISLALAQDSLARAGITEPSSEQVVIALNGGTITNANGETVTLAGVLTLRAAGQGWGDIARSLDVKLGHVVRELHAANRRIETGASLQPTRAERLAGKPDRVTGRPETAGRPEHAGGGRPDWAGRSGPPNPGQMGRPGGKP